MEILSKDLTQTKDLARRVAQELKPNGVLALYGDLGSGKTTFTRYLVEELGFDSRVQSPTFVIVRHYKGHAQHGIKLVNHLDLYRLQTLGELEDIGILELINTPSAVTVIEWPEIAEPLLPATTKKLYFKDEGGNKCIKYI